MKKFHLSPSQFKTVSQVDFSETGNQIRLDEGESALYTSDLGMLLIILNEEITSKGMDDEDTVNAYGKALYNLYDAIYYQA